MAAASVSAAAAAGPGGGGSGLALPAEHRTFDGLAACAAPALERVRLVSKGVGTRANKIPRIGGVPLCKAFCFGRECPAVEKGFTCKYAHVPMEERPRCPEYDATGRCVHGEECFMRHAPPNPAFAQPHAALLCLPQFAERAAERAEEVCGAGAVVGAVRADPSAAGNVLVLVGASNEAASNASTTSAAAKATIAGLVSCPFLMAYAHRVLRLDGAPAADTSTALRAAARALPASGARVRVRAFPNTDARTLADGLMSAAGDASKEAALAAGGATHVLDIATVYGTTYHSLWSLSCDAAPPMDPPALSSRLQAAMGPGGEAAQCRAYYKMAEASERRMVARGVVARPGWLCADVGASPGGWTQWLCHEITHAREVAVAEGAQDDASGHVWAIDPAELELSPMPSNATHIRLKLTEGEDCEARAQLSAGLAARGGGRKLDVLCCDANIHPRQVARVVRALAPLCARGGALVVSMKNFCATRSLMVFMREVEAAVSELVACGSLERGSAELVHLLANGVQERCLLATLTGEDNGYVDASADEKMATLVAANVDAQGPRRAKRKGKHGDARDE